MFFRKRSPLPNGYIDSADCGHMHGWVYDRMHGKKRWDVDIYAGGAVIGQARADELRTDLAAAGMGDGRYGFSFQPPADIPPESLAAKVSGVDFWLPNSAGRITLNGATKDFLNTPRRGLPLLHPALTSRLADARDEEIAAELLEEWRRHAPEIQPHVKRQAKGPSMWRTIVRERHRGLLDCLKAGDPAALARYLVDLQKAPEAAGIVQGQQAYDDFIAANPEGRRAAVAPFHDMLASLAQYLGVARAECAEQDFVGAALVEPSEILARRIAERLGHAIVPPPVFDGLYGLGLDDGLLHGRDIQALYAALRVIEASEMASPHICEIGAGFGQVAYYAFARGTRHYTIIDLPSVCAMQYFYLRRCGLPVRFVSAALEPADRVWSGVNLILAQSPAAETIACDIALNCDSFPEMGEAICRDYFQRLGKAKTLVLSVNQEGRRAMGDDRQTVVGDLIGDYGFSRKYRFRSWVRRGFVEELWSAKTPPAASA